MIKLQTVDTEQRVRWRGEQNVTMEGESWTRKRGCRPGRWRRRVEWWPMRRRRGRKPGRWRRNIFSAVTVTRSIPSFIS